MILELDWYTGSAIVDPIRIRFSGWSMEDTKIWFQRQKKDAWAHTGKRCCLRTQTSNKRTFLQTFLETSRSQSSPCVPRDGVQDGTRGDGRWQSVEPSVGFFSSFLLILPPWLSWPAVSVIGSGGTNISMEDWALDIGRLFWGWTWLHTQEGDCLWFWMRVS